MNLKKRILIICEDSKSSLTYFKSFKKDEEFKRKLSGVSVEPFHPQDYSPMGLVREAIAMKKAAKKEKNPYDYIWVVLDKDTHANLVEAINVAAQNNIRVALSIICFEYWVLLHFEYTTKAFHSSDEIIRYIRTEHYSNYQKGGNCFNFLRPHINDAVRNAEAIKQNYDSALKYYELSAYTNVHELVAILINPE